MSVFTKFPRCESEGEGREVNAGKKHLLCLCIHASLCLAMNTCQQSYLLGQAVFHRFYL